LPVQKKTTSHQISVEISKEIEGGVYANQVIIIHSHKEFILDFGFSLPTGKMRIQSRIITTPQDAKAILLALKENIEKYERQFGPLPSPPKTPPTLQSQQIH